MNRMLILLTLAAVGLAPTVASAQLGRLLRGGMKGVVKRSGFVVREGAEEAAEQSAKRLALPALRESVEVSAQTIGGRSAAQATADFAWRNKGSIGVGVAAAAALQPEVAKAAIEVTGQQVVRPLIESSAQHVARPIVTEASRAFPWRLLLLLLAAWAFLRWTVRRLRHGAGQGLRRLVSSGQPKESAVGSDGRSGPSAPEELC